jgi:oligopeptide/dipeptide ABC transporter ATP-binding protein
MSENGTLLRVRNLRTSFDTEDGLVRAVDGVSFRVARGRTFALVGESGCGKSVTAFSILRLISCPPGRIAGEGIEFEGRNLLDLPESQMRQVRGGEIGMIFQEPMSSLNPVFTCGSQIVEAIRLHSKTTGGQARDLAVDLLARVGIPEPARRFREYPHQLSGGMRQRVMIAMALSCNPRLLIADEPTTALDVTIQAQILDLLKEIQGRTGLSIMLITHDLAVVAETAHAVAVMYASKIVEFTDVRRLFGRPLHPYTHGLFRSVPRLGERKTRLQTLGGTVPNPLSFPSGCKFHPRCLLARQAAAKLDAGQTVSVITEEGPARVPKRCAAKEPSLREMDKGHWCACWEQPGYEDAPQTDPSEGGSDAKGNP